ncbi:hypothetical protein IV454_23070 [Massilia antarctica]|uniref:Translation elongation factor EFG/EF2 domain-containing protein n=1 Tax=Massilia antarctica TaxID=2765360 RepID=A0AA48WAI5_9BURK|nr:hypothetical protein [Massilia antarctica]QPI48396.1 hypothetical protein IV454_23070 [Massilia antarctica]
MEIALVETGTRGVPLRTRCTGAGRFVRQMGPPGRFGVIDLVLEPEPIYGCTLSWEVSEEQIPLLFLDAVISSIKHVLSEDAFDGDYLSGCRIRIVDGAYNSTDSKISCYQMATVMAMREALRSAGLYAPADSTAP